MSNARENRSIPDHTQLQSIHQVKLNFNSSQFNPRRPSEIQNLESPSSRIVESENLQINDIDSNSSSVRQNTPRSSKIKAKQKLHESFQAHPPPPTPYSESESDYDWKSDKQKHGQKTFKSKFLAGPQTQIKPDVKTTSLIFNRLMNEDTIAESVLSLWMRSYHADKRIALEEAINFFIKVTGSLIRHLVGLQRV